MLTNSTELCDIQQNLDDKTMIIIKFTADWCGPCKAIKSTVHECYSKCPESIKLIEIDIDESIDLYVFLKNKKMINGIPALLAYYSGEKEFFYVPDDSCLGGNVNNVKQFFQRCIDYVK